MGQEWQTNGKGIGKWEVKLSACVGDIKSSWKIYLKYEQDCRVARWLWVCAALSEDMSWVPNTHIRKVTAACNPSPSGSKASVFCGHLPSSTHNLKERNKETKKEWENRRNIYSRRNLTGSHWAGMASDDCRFVGCLRSQEPQPCLWLLQHYSQCHPSFLPPLPELRW